MIERANNVKYGLSGCVWSENSGTTHRVAQAMEVSKQAALCFSVLYTSHTNAGGDSLGQLLAGEGSECAFWRYEDVRCWERRAQGFIRVLH